MELLLFALAVILLAATAGFIAARVFPGAADPSLAARLAKAEAELKAQQSSQAQVIHTTKLASLGQMVAGVAHELNTPLGFLKSNCEVVGELLREYEDCAAELIAAADAVEDSPLDPERLERLRDARTALSAQTAGDDARELLRDALDGVSTLTGLVRNLKGFARLDRDGVDQIDLNDSIKSSLAVVAHLMRDRVKVVERLSPLPKIHGMPSQINQVVMNLLTNAAQAIEEHGTVTVASRVVDDAHVEISVADTGSGIPEDVLPKIFDPFFTTKPVGEGTGLGLSIAHKIVKSHGGTIGVKSTAGRGTTFTVTLPTDALDASDGRAPAAALTQAA